MFGLHMPELIIILVVALLIFGPKKLPEMGSSIGKTIKQFREGMNEISQSKSEPKSDRSLDFKALEPETLPAHEIPATPPRSEVAAETVNSEAASPEAANSEIAKPEIPVE